MVESNWVSTGGSDCKWKYPRVHKPLASFETSLEIFPPHSQLQLNAPSSPGLISVPLGHQLWSPCSTAIFPCSDSTHYYLVIGHWMQLSCAILDRFYLISFLVFPAFGGPTGPLEISELCLILQTYLVASPPTLKITSILSHFTFSYCIFLNGCVIIILLLLDIHFPPPVFHC